MGRRNINLGTSKNAQLLGQIKAVLNDLQEYWPLTLRQIYYQLVAKEYIANNKTQYNAISKVLKQARMEEQVPWEAMEDRIRTHKDNTGYINAREYIATQLYYFLNNYERNYQIGQEVYLEIWIEKDALSRIFQNEADKYRVPVQVCRGYVSVSMLNEYRNRVLQVQQTAVSIGQPVPRPVILYYGDFDPSGIHMFLATQQTLKQEIKLHGVEYLREALNVEDIQAYRLPHSIEALKNKDPRAAQHKAQYGNLAVELDALPPAVLAQKVRQAIERELDPYILQLAQQKEATEAGQIHELRREVEKLAQAHGY